MSREGVDAAIERERLRRKRLVKRGRPLHYWQERGDDQPPPEEHWCVWCVGFYGVPHDHEPGGVCQFAYRAAHGDRQCACIDCVVAEAAGVHA